MTYRRTDRSELEALFSREAEWQSWLDVEVVLAEVQADLHIIPQWAAEAIAAVADVEALGLASLEAEAARTRAPIVALTRVLSARAGEAGAYVHWGATTQNVMQAGRLLVMRRAFTQLCEHLAMAVERLAQLADSHADTPMIGRTNRRHALPISFGFKIAGWIEELERATERLASMEMRVFVLPFGGAVGAMHAFEGRGREINQRMAARLGLRTMLVPGRAVNDIFADYVVQLALWAMTVERIASELYALMGEEISEVSENLGPEVVGSSTMPHKVNPKLVVHVIAMAADLRSAAIPAMQGALTMHEGDAAANHLTTRTLDRVGPLSLSLARAFEELCSLVEPRPQRMLSNLLDSDAHPASERLMMLIAPALGHGAAHDLLHDLFAVPGVGADQVASHLAAMPELTGRLTGDDVLAALDPTTYLGESARIARDSASLGRAVAKRLRVLGGTEHHR